MASVSEILDRLDQSAARRTQAQPFRQFQENQAGGGLDIPSFGGGSGGGMPDLGGMPQLGGGGRGGLTDNEFERLVNPRRTEGLQMAESQFESAQHQAAALGMEDMSGEPPQGFLNTLFRGLDFPRAAVFNAARAAFDPEMDFEDFREAVDDREGFGELSGLVMEEDDSGIERVLKGGAAFLGDVATDPLAYISMGASVVGKKLGSRAVQKAVRNRADDFLDHRTIEGFAERNFHERVRNVVSREDLSDEARQALNALGKNTRGAGELGRDALGDAAAESYQRAGATGLREFLEDMGPQGRKLWDSLPSDMKGGLRLRVPFSQQEGVRQAILLSGGGGQLAERMGLRPAVMKAHQWRNSVRASKASQSMSKAFGGANGDLYGKMVSDTIHAADDDVSGITYGLYRTLTEAQDKAHLTRKVINQTGNETLSRIQHRLSTVGKKPDQEEARDAFQQWVHDPEELHRLFDYAPKSAQGLEVDEQGRLFLDLPEGQRELTPPEVAGLESAKEYHDTLRHMFKEALDAGVHINELNDYYIPRALSQAKKEEMAAKRVGGMRLGSVSDMDPRKRRQQFVELVAETNDDGVVFSRMRQLSPEEANQRAKARTRMRREAEGKDAEEIEEIDFFETDPGVMLSRYTNALSHVAADAKFAQMVRRAGGVIEGDQIRRPILRTRELAEAQERLDEAAAHLREAPASEITPRIRRLMGDFENLRALTHRTINDPTLPVEEQVKNTETLLKTMDQHLDVLPNKKSADAAIKNARREYKAAVRQAQESIGRQPEAGELSRLFHEQDLQLMGARRGEEQVRRMPPELDMAFAPERMRQAISQYYKLRGPEAQNLIDKWYRPYHAMFKVTATVGRGPGFHIRNFVGGDWNNQLLGVTMDDRWAASRIASSRVEAGRRARKEVADDAIKRTGAARHEVTNGPGFEDAVARRAEEILNENLSGTQVTKDLSLYDVHRLMVEHEVDWRPARLHAFADVGEAESGFMRTTMMDPAPSGPVATRAAKTLSRLTGEEVDPARLRVHGKAFAGGKHASMYPTTARENLSAGQRAAESLANLWWVRFNAGAAEMTETYLRGTAFINGLKKYDGDAEVAKLFPLATQFDYEDLSPFERKWLRGALVPFYTWTRHNIPLQLRGLAQQPGRMNRLNLALDNAEEAFGDDDVDVLPEWMKDRFMFATRFKFDGNPLAFGLETPAQDLNEWLKVSPDGSPVDLDSIQRMTRTFMSALNPAFSVPGQWLAGTEFFTGAALDESAGRHAPWWYQMLPQRVAPKWVNSDGDIMGDARIITSGPGAVPWLGQSEKLLAIAGQMGLPVPEGAQALENRNRFVSDAVRQFFPVVTAGTITPQSESGELFQRARRLRNDALRHTDPKDQETVRMLREMGMDLEEISLVMQRMRARRAQAAGTA